MLENQLPEYFAWIERARSHASSALDIRAGLECDWLTGCEDWIETLANRYSWDYLIGSVHYLDDWNFDNPAWLGRWAEADIEAVWTHYWQSYSAMARSGLFDILAHPDLIKKFTYQPAGDLRRFYEPCLEAIANADSAIEINTAGLHKPCAEFYPDPLFLRLAAEASIPLIISSDAHAPGEVARDFPLAIEMAQKAGYQETQLFQQRQRTAELLPT